MFFETSLIGMTSGCFDLLHAGHIWLFNKCREYCDCLIVGVARDKITKTKKPPIMNEKQRLYVVKNIKSVYAAVLEDNKMPPENLRKLFKKYKPQIYFTTPDNHYFNECRKLCEEMGVVLKVIKRNNKGIFNISTSGLIKDVKEKIK